jgi:type IV pilus assembly protein PilV
MNRITTRRIVGIHRSGGRLYGQGGFSMIEVLIALVVLAVGLLGLALLQTVNLRYTKSAQQRTMAVNLASEMLDTMRTNVSEVEQYVMTEATFGSVAPGEDGCDHSAEALTAAGNVARWKCEVREALGPGAYAIVEQTADGWSVTVVWNEEQISPLSGEGEVTLVSTL